MATIGNISVSITAQTDKFIKGVNRVIGKLGDMAAKAAAVGAATAGAAAAGVSYLVQQQMQAIDVTAKLSDTLGISTENLAAYQHAADLAGVSNEQLHAGLNRFIRLLPKGSDVGGSFEKVARDITSIQDPAERARAAIEVFGKAGAAMIPLLASNFSEARAETVKFGTAFSRVDAAQVEAANDAVSRLLRVARGAATVLAVKLSPFIEAAARKLVGMATDGKTVGVRMAEGFGVALKAIGRVMDEMARLRYIWHEFSSLVNRSIAKALPSVEEQEKAWKTIKKYNPKAKMPEELRLAKNIALNAKQETERAQKAFNEWKGGDNSSRANKLFEEIQAGALKAAKVVADEMTKIQDNAGEKINGLKDVEDFLEKSKTVNRASASKQQEIGGFREFSQRLISVSGLSMLGRKMEVHDPQLKETNKLLKEIAGVSDEGAVFS